MRKRMGPLLILAVLIAGICLFARSTTLVENIYSKTIYKTLIPPLSRLTGVFPVSLAEIVIVVLVMWLLIELIIGLRQRFQSQLDGIGSSFLSLIMVVAIVYLSFQCLWGLNYHRLEFAEMAGLEIRAISVQELEVLTQTLVDEVNQLRTEVLESRDGVMRLACRQEVLEQAIDGYTALAVSYPQLEGRYGKPKGLLFSEAISYLGIYGFFMPFTGEANINTDIPDSMLPFSTCHEMAHQRGIAREDEANFIAYLSCSMNPHADFQYSGNLLALSYALGAIRARDEGSFQKMKNSLAPGIIRDLQNLTDFAQQHRGPLNHLFERVNDVYLKANSQSAGVRSYSGILEFLVAAQRQQLSEYVD